MLDPSLKDKEGLPLTIRAVFIVGELIHRETIKSPILNSAELERPRSAGPIVRDSKLTPACAAACCRH